MPNILKGSFEDKRTDFWSPTSCIYTPIFWPKQNLFFFDPEKVKKWASKVANNWPRPFYFTVQPRHKAQN
jgi:hypothetical protein